MIDMIDKPVLDFHQWIVDLTQKKPRWCAQQAFYLMALFTCFKIFWERPSIAYIFVCSFVLTLLWVLLRFRTDDRLSSIGSMRMLLWVFPVLDLIRMFNGHTDAGNAAQLASDVMFVAVYYFCSCKPPKPRLPKTKLVPQL